MAPELVNSVAQRHILLPTLFKFFCFAISEVLTLFLKQFLVQVGYSYFRAYDQTISKGKKRLSLSISIYLSMHLSIYLSSLPPLPISKSILADPDLSLVARYLVT